MSFLLRIKSWILFLIMVIPLAIEVIAFATLGLAIFELGESEETIVLAAVLVLALVITGFFSLVLTFCWLYVMGAGLYTKLPDDHNLKLGRFKFAFFFPIIYFIFLFFYFLYSADHDPPYVLLVMSVWLFAILCLFYVLYFAAKALKTVELQRRAGFGDYAGDFFLLWFYIVGVWIIQPRLNKLFAQEEVSEYGGPVDRYLK